MDQLFSTLCKLALDPFAREKAMTNGESQALRERLAELSDAETAVAGGDFTACYACSEPGDDPPPFMEPSPALRACETEL
jgi:hypothetical protein